MKKWWYTLVLGVCYLVIFHAWMYCTTQFQVKITGISLSIFLFVLGTFFYKKYFYGGFDYIVHMSIPLDIFLEGYFIYPHENYFFYGCFVGFAIVLVAYRTHKGKQANVTVNS